MFGGVVAIGDPSDWIERLAVKLLEAGAAVALGVAGISEVASRIRQREWEKRTRYLVLSLLQRAEEELASLEEAAYAVLVQSLAEEHRHDVLPVTPAFAIPTEAVQTRYFLAAVDLAQVASAVVCRMHSEADGKLTELKEAKLSDDLHAIRWRIESMQTYVGEETAKPAHGPGKPQPARAVPPPHALQAADATRQRSGSTPATGPPLSGDARSLQASSIDWSELRSRADAALPGLRASWHTLEATIRQLSGLLDTDGATELLEASIALRHGIWKYKPSAPEPVDDPPDTGDELRAARQLTWRVQRSRDASVMVLRVLETGWLVLGALDDIFGRRAGDFAAAADHRKFKREHDEISVKALERRGAARDTKLVLRDLDEAMQNFNRERLERTPGHAGD